MLAMTNSPHFFIGDCPPILIQYNHNKCTILLAGCLWREMVSDRIERHFFVFFLLASLSHPSLLLAAFRENVLCVYMIRFSDQAL